jgi:signal transduction histidine kinase
MMPSDELALRQALNAAMEDAKAARQELAQARAELEDFTYSMSHDLRASLRHITSYARILREDLGHVVDPGVSSSLDAITHAALHQGRLIEGLMALARVARVDLLNAPVPLDELLADVCAGLEREMAPELASRKLQWQLAAPLPVVRGDAALVRLVLQQVLANALKFTRSRETAQIEITCVEQQAQGGVGSSCELRIRDNGVGFNPQYQHKLFHAFSRLHPGAAFEGIGIGLALCQVAVKRLGGAISASGEVDGGCTVCITLPLDSTPVAG